MGNLLDRWIEDEIEDQTINPSTGHYSQHDYLYPPRYDCYFAGHFIMGGERFETCQPGAYLFGDNMDLNFLGPRPLPFPYSAKSPDEPYRSLRALVNIRKETLRLIKIGTIETVNRPEIVVPSLSTMSPIKINNRKTSKIKPSTVTADQSSSPHHHQSQQPKATTKVSQASQSTSPLSVTETSSTSASLSLKSSSVSLKSLTASPSPVKCQTQEDLQLQGIDDELNPSSSSSSGETLYTIEFTFDSDVKCSITIYYLCLEEITPAGLIYTPHDPSYKSLTYNYPSGANQLFSQPESLIFNPSAFHEDDLSYPVIDEDGTFDPTVPFPIVIQINAEEGSEPRQSHSLIATIERNADQMFHIKPFKQKIVIDGLTYLIQEVYGIENKNLPTKSDDKQSYFAGDDEIEDNGSECVICMSESRDTLILPCRHLCLCKACADSLRYQANNCPICRSPFRALLQFKACRKRQINATSSSAILPITTTASGNSVANNNISSSSSTSTRQRLSQSSPLESKNSSTSSTRQPTATTVDNDVKNDCPPGYESISLIEALNGPLVSSSSSSPSESSTVRPHLSDVIIVLLEK